MLIHDFHVGVHALNEDSQRHRSTDRRNDVHHRLAELFIDDGLDECTLGRLGGGVERVQQVLRGLAHSQGSRGV